MPKTKKGHISIHTENIFPIIKKWLYSDHEIFLRELVSNSFDATNKLQKLAKMESLELTQTPHVNIKIDKDAKTLTISDTGLGMTAEEVEKYITQIAFSSAEEFVEKFKDSDEKADIIGHFGLGFYSAFMVAEKVEISSLSYQKDSKAILWECDGSTEYSVKEGKKDTIGTDVILHINDENKEYLEELRINTLVEKYLNFLPIDIQVNGKTANKQNPLWVKTPAETTEADYKEFYKTLFPMNQEPLFWIHLNVDYPFNLKGILYFPKVLHELDGNKGQVKLFCKQVFVSDNAKDVIPEFLTLLQGCIDLPEIPLNVSRSYLQNDPYVQKISKHIIKKVADKLNSLFKTDYAQYQSIFNDIGPFVKYGMMQNQDFYEKVKDIIIFDTSTDKKTSIKDYLERNKAKLENKVLYCEDKESQATYVQLCKDQDLEVLYLHTIIDSHFIQFLESKDSEVTFVAIDSQVSDLLVDAENKDAEAVDTNAVEAIFKETLNKDKLKIEFKSLKSADISGMILESDMTKRMRSMSHFMQGGNMPKFDDDTLVLNQNNSLIKNLISLSKDENKKDLVQDLTHHVYDLAKMSHKPLAGIEMQAFINRSNKLMREISAVN